MRPLSSIAPSTTLEHDEEEDDYMNMVFDDAPIKAGNVAFSGARDCKAEGEKRGRLKSKAELAAEEDISARKKAALSRSLFDAPISGPPARIGGPTERAKGLAMMAKMGFKGWRAWGDGQ